MKLHENNKKNTTDKNTIFLMQILYFYTKATSRDCLQGAQKIQLWSEQIENEIIFPEVFN